MIDWTKLGPGNSPSPNAPDTTAPIAPQPTAAPSNPPVGPDPLAAFADPAAGQRYEMGKGFNPNISQEEVDAMDPGARIGRGLDALGYYLFGNPEGQEQYGHQAPLAGTGPLKDIIGGAGDFMRGGVDLTVVKPFEAFAAGVARVPMAWLPGGADDNFKALGEWAEKNDPKVYQEWLLVKAASDQDILYGGNMKADFNIEVAKYLDDQLYESQLGTTPELAIGRAAYGSLGGALSQAITGWLGVASNWTQRELAEIGAFDVMGIPDSVTYEDLKSEYAGKRPTGTVHLNSELRDAFEALEEGKITEGQAQKFVESVRGGGRNRIEASAARMEAGLEVSDVEKMAVDAWQSGAWSMEHAQDWLVSHGQGISSNFGVQLIGSLVTDPLTYATIGAGGVASMGKTGARVIESGFQAASNYERAAVAVRQAQLVRLGNIQKIVKGVDMGELGTAFRIARGLIDPFAVYKPSTVQRAVTDLKNGLALESFHRAYGQFAVKDLRAIAREFNLGPEIDSAIASYSIDQANLMIAIRAQREMLEQGLGEAMIHTNVDDVIDPMVRQAGRDALDDLTDHMMSTAKNTFTAEEEASLAGRLASTFGNDVPYWAKRMAGMSDDLKRGLHAVTYKVAEKDFMEAIAKVMKYEGELPLDRLVLMTADTLDDVTAKSIAKNIIDMLANEVEPERIAAATAEWNQQAIRYPAMQSIGYATGGQTQVEALVKELSRQVEAGQITRRAMPGELADPALKQVRDVLDRHSIPVGVTLSPSELAARAQQTATDAAYSVNQLGFQTVSAAKFYPAAKKAVVTDLMKKSEYGNMRLFLSGDGKSGFALASDGTVASTFGDLTEASKHFDNLSAVERGAGFQRGVSFFDMTPEDQAVVAQRLVDQGYLFHGSSVDPRTGGSVIAGEGFFTTESFEYARLYGRGTIKNSAEAAANGSVYVVKRPSNTADLADPALQSKLREKVAADLEVQLEARQGLGASALERAAKRVANATTDSEMSSALSDYAIERSRLLKPNMQGWDTTFINKMLRESTDAPAVRFPAENMGSVGGKQGDLAPTVVFLKKPELKSIDDVIGYSAEHEAKVAEYGVASKSYDAAAAKYVEDMKAWNSLDEAGRKGQKPPVEPVKPVKPRATYADASVLPTVPGSQPLWRVGFRPSEEVAWGLRRSDETGLYMIDRAPTISHVVDAVPGRQKFSDTTRNFLGQIIGKSGAERLNGPIESMEALINTQRDVVTGRRLVMNMERRFEKSMFDAGVPKPIAKDIFAKAREVAGLDFTTIRGIRPTNVWAAVNDLIPRDLVLKDGSRINVHTIMDHLLEAAEGDLRIMGVSSVLSQRMRNQLRKLGDGSNWVGMMTTTMYNKLRYSQPTFLIQRVVDAPYYSILYGVTPLGKPLSALTGGNAALRKITDNLGRTGLARHFSMDMPEYATRSNFTEGIKSAMQEAGLKESMLQRIIEAPDTMIANNMTNMLHARLGDMVRGTLDNLQAAAARDPELAAEMLQAGLVLTRSFEDWRAVYSQMVGRVLDDNEVGLMYIQDQLNAWRRHVVNEDGTLDFSRLIHEGDMFMPADLGQIESIKPALLAKELGYADSTALRRDVVGHIEKINGEFVLVKGEHDIAWLKEVLTGPNGLHASPDYVKRAIAYYSETWDDFWHRLSLPIEKGGQDISAHYAKEAQEVIAGLAAERGMDPWEYLSGVMLTNIGPEQLDTAMGRFVNFLKGGTGSATPGDWGVFFRSHLDPSAQKTLTDEWVRMQGGTAVPRAVPQGFTSDAAAANRAASGHTLPPEIKREGIFHVTVAKDRVMTEGLRTAGPAPAAAAPAAGAAAAAQTVVPSGAQVSILDVVTALRNIAGSDQSMNTALQNAGKVGTIPDLAKWLGDVYGITDSVTAETFLRAHPEVFQRLGGQSVGGTVARKLDMSPLPGVAPVKVAPAPAAAAPAKPVTEGFGSAGDATLQGRVSFLTDRARSQTYMDRMRIAVLAARGEVSAADILKQFEGVYESGWGSATAGRNAMEGALGMQIGDVFAHFSTPELRYQLVQRLNAGLVGGPNLTAQQRAVILTAPFESVRQIEPSQIAMLEMGMKEKAVVNRGVDVAELTAKPEDLMPLGTGAVDTTKFFDGDIIEMLKARAAAGPHANSDVEGVLQEVSKLVQKTLKGSAGEGETRNTLRNLVESIPTTEATPFNRSQALVVSLLKQKIADSEQDIFRLAEMQTKRSVLERSLNHPLFALYPASYMWGKVLPETAKFLAKNPYAATYTIAHVQRSIAIQREYDRELDDKVAAVDRSAGAFLLDYLTPGLPWADHQARMSPLMRGVLEGKDIAWIWDSELATVSPHRWVSQIARTVTEIPDLVTRINSNEGDLPGWAGGLQDATGSPEPVAPVEGETSQITGPTKASALAPILQDHMSRLSSILLQGAPADEE